jgi:DNA ligase-1
MDYIETLLAQHDIPWLTLIEHKYFTQFSQLNAYYENVVSNSGEGLMLNKADAYYQTGRTDSIIKLKPYLDAEAMVIKHLSGKGKYKNMMGSLLVRNKQGKEFKIGTGFSDKQRQQPPKIGSIITYRYTGATKTGLPRFPVFIRIRTDMEEL